MRHFGKGFLKDIALLLIFTIVVGSGFSSAVAYAIDTYFGDTISSLAGEYGENQLIVHVRQEAKAAAEAQLRQLLQEEFPGAKLKEGIVIAGTANFFIRLPQSAITREVFSNLGKYFNDLPGQSGYTVLLEPTVIVEGVQGNIYGQLIEEIENLAHVRFAFRQGGQIYVLLTKPEYSKQVTDEINRILARDQIVELRFPQGYKVDSASVGDQLASALSLELNTQVKNVSSSGKNAELDSLMETLTQLKGFLESYATKVELTVEAQSEVKRGCLVSFGGQNIVGEPPGEGNLVAKIQTVSGQKATGIIQKGNSQTILGEDGKEKLDAYLLQDGVVQAKAGQLLVENNKVLLAKSLGESKKLLTELAHTSREAEEAATASLATIETFQETKAQVEGVERLLSQLNELLASPLGSARQAELDELMELATKASAQTGKLLASKGKLSSLSELEDNLSKILALLPQTHPLRSNLEGLTAALGMLSGSDDWSSLAPQLTSWRSNLAQEILKLVRADRDGKKEQVAKLLKATRQLTGAMAQMDPSPFVPSLKLVAERAQAFSKIDLEGIGEQASKLQSALPELSDEKITKSLQTVDRYVEGEAAPTEKISLYVEDGADIQKAQRIVKQQLGTDKLSVYNTQLGVVEPNMRSEVMRILGEVRLTIAAIFVVLVTISTLVLDHATLITAFRFWSRNHQHKRQGRKQWLENGLPYVYGAGVGAFLLGCMTLLTGAELPLLPRGGIIALGAILGLSIALLAERLSPVNTEEMVAGEAMGLYGCQILRQIVIPAGRPGFLQLLNKRKGVFGKRGGNLA